MINSGLLLCSFYLKKRFARNEEELNPLNSSYEFKNEEDTPVTFDNVLEMIKQFCNISAEGADDEKSMKLFSIDTKSIVEYNNTSYMALSFVVSSGAYGLESTITDRHTREVRYQCGEDDATVKDFKCLIYIPKDTNDVTVTKGIMIFQTLSTYGVKTITVKQMKSFFAELGLTLETRSVSVRLFIEKLIEKGSLYKVTLIRNRTAPDAADNMLISTGREERSFIKPSFKQTWIDKFLKAIDGQSDTDLLEMDDGNFDDITVTFKLGKSYRTVRLTEIDRFSVVEDIPEQIYSQSRTNSEILVNHMLETANIYKDKMVFSVNSEV